MKFATLIRRGLVFHWRAHLGVVLGAAVGSAALIGALVVGDSVKGSLRAMALARIGQVHLVLASGDRMFTQTLANALQTDLRDRYSQPVVVAPAFLTQCAVTTGDSSARANKVQVIGVDDEFWKLAPHMWRETDAPARGVAINEALARQLGVKPGTTIILRLPKPSALTREFAVSERSDSTLAMRLEVGRVVSAEEFGDFNLQSSQFAPLNVFIPLAELQAALNLTDKLNLMLVGGNVPLEDPYRYDSFLQVRAERELAERWSLADAQVQTRALTNETGVELRTPRVFLDSAIARATIAADTNARPILTYLVNLLSAATNTTPYSMVTAAGAPWTPADMRDDEIVVSQWLAEDLRVSPGDEIALTYFDPESGARLIEQTNIFRVRGIVPLGMPWADRTLLPDFPGIEKAESTSDWDAGFPLVHKIRQKDEDYWKQNRGMPKAFVTLAAGQKMWGNRFGEQTAIRFPMPTRSVGDEVTSLISGKTDSESPHVASYKEALEKKILASLKPEELGLRFVSVRELALKAAAQSQDFGGLFLGFSFFVIAAALLLMALLFSLGLEQRAPEIGTLLALGFTPKQMRRLLLWEGVALSLFGGIVGALGGLAYARAMLHGLTTIWRDAVGASVLSFHFTAQTMVIGLFASVVVSVITIWLTLRKFARRPARELLVGEVRVDESKVRSPKSKVVGIGALLAGLGLVGWALATDETANAGAFFGAGALVLIAGLSFVSAWLVRMERRAPAQLDDENPAGTKQTETALGAPITLASLAIRGCARRRKRSLSTVAMLACGSFLIVSIGVFRLDANRDATARDSGTGGFALIGETTMPVVQDLNSKSGREYFTLNEKELEGVSFVPCRVRDGDEASCLNLSAAQSPRLLGVKPELIWDRFAFTGRLNEMTKFGRWFDLHRSSLSFQIGENEIPAIGDANSIQWAMHKKVGDTIDYVDEQGQPFKVCIVGAVANSILQGQLIIDETEFVKRFPGERGYRTFLIDAPSNNVSQVSAALSRAMQDVGLELTPAAHRLAQFNAVQNTYLGTFQVLGGLGLLLGSVGLGIVVLRNVLERRGELAVLMAVGFRKATLQRLLLIENGALLLLGLAIGIVAALVAVLPSALSPGSELPYVSLALTLGGVLVNGALWTWAATRFAVRGDLLAALRNE